MDDEVTPLFPDETEEAIRARWDAWANEGRDPAVDVDEWTDTRPLSMFQLVTEPMVREAARIYDLMGSEVVASTFVVWSWGDYLDDHGESVGVFRLAATSAAGEATFAGPAGTEVGAGTAVGVAPLGEDSDVEPPEYEVVAGGVVPNAGGGVGELTLAVRAVEPGSAGNVGAGAVTELLTPIEGVTVTNADAIVGGEDVEDDEALLDRILARGAGEGGGRAIDYQNWLRAYDGVGAATVVPLWAGPGTVLGVVTTGDGGAVSAERLAEIQADLDPPGFETELTAAVNLPAASLPVASTEGLRPGPGVVRLGGALVGYQTFDADSIDGASGGAGAFAAGAAVSQGGYGRGRAPIGHNVLVRTAVGLDVTVAATLEFVEGYSLDGDGGTVAVRAVAEEAVEGYVTSVAPGGEVVLAQVVARLATTPGVHDVSGVTLNGAAANVAVPGGADPRVPRVPAGGVDLEGGGVAWRPGTTS